MHVVHSLPILLCRRTVEIADHRNDFVVPTDGHAAKGRRDSAKEGALKVEQKCHPEFLLVLVGCHYCDLPAPMLTRPVAADLPVLHRKSLQLLFVTPSGWTAAIPSPRSVGVPVRP